MLTDKQAKALDALRHGGTIADVAERRGLTHGGAAYCVGKLLRRGLLSKGGPGNAFVYTLTESGRAAWAESLR